MYSTFKGTYAMEGFSGLMKGAMSNCVVAMTAFSW